MISVNPRVIYSILFFLSSAMHGAYASSEHCNALSLANQSAWEPAIKCAASERNSLLLKLVLWSKYHDEISDSKTEEILHFVSENPHFPDSRTLRAVAEHKINDKTSVNSLKKWFTSNKPVTDTGVKYYFYLMEPSLNPEEKKTWIKKVWIQSPQSKKEGKDFLKNYRKILTPQDHIAKIDHLISSGNKKIDPDLMALVSKEYQALFKARLKINNNSGNLKKIISQVPESLRSNPELIYAQAVWYEKRGQYLQIAQLMSKYSKVSKLKSDSWFKLRTRTALELTQKGRFKAAYNLASDHEYQDPVNYVDSEWIAGKIAYLDMKNYKMALKHFESILSRAKYPVSISKSAYWAGVASLELNQKEKAEEYFKLASKHLSTFYGQASLVHLGQDNAEIVSLTPVVTKSDINAVNKNELVRASEMFAREYNFVLTRKFAESAYYDMKTPGKHYFLTEFAAEKDLPNLSVAYNKVAEKHGFFNPEYSYPTANLLPIQDTDAEPALILSIIRQESQFHRKATSSADARGLMQMIDKTAKSLSKELNLCLTEDSLYDPSTNVKLGCHYISKLLKKYDNNYILTIGAYNAGPSAVNRWIKQYGDPRTFTNAKQSIEWIEKVPFYETRTYIQHVLSNLQIYRNIIENEEQETELKTLKIDLSKELGK